MLGGLDRLVRVELADGARGPEVDATLWARFERAWSRCLVADPGGVDEVVTTGLTKPSELGSDHDIAVVLTHLTQAVTHALITQQVGRLFMVHAGGVSHPATGDSLVFVAPGGTGKSTLARALGSHYGYLSDETIGMRADGSIVAYPKPLSLRGDGPVKHEVSPDDLGLQPAHTTPRLRKLVLLRRVHGVEGLDVEHLGTLDAIEALGPETSSLGHLPGALHVVADLLAATGGAERWTYGDHTDLRAVADAALGSAR
ncbi:hypothetical protein ACQB6R_01635 [Propionibacteriaceae bacterium G1746]